MTRRIGALGLCAYLLTAPALLHAGDAPAVGRVSVPLGEWTRLQDALLPARREPPPEAVCPLGRTVVGEFRKGLLSATLETRFVVLAEQGFVKVPVLDAAASLREALLDGLPTSLVREGDLYVLGLDRPGVYSLTVRFFLGEEQDRFARRLRFRLPPAGPTKVEVLLPEQDIEPSLANGALSVPTPGPDGTRIEGHLDATGVFDLSWTRRATHRSAEQVRLEVRANALLTVQEALVAGLAVFDFNVIEGETDRLELRVPAGLEVIKVDGDAVLQWRTEAAAEGKLILLLRYLVAERTRVSVHFQSPLDIDKPVPLLLPLPPDAVPWVGMAGVQAPAGLNVRVASQDQAEPLTVRDLPAELTELTASPLLFGFRFTAPPRIQLSVARHAEVELTGTVIDEVEASTLLLEDGSEVTKVKLHMRNNTRQYLRLLLPAGAVLTHSLIDGQPVRPALVEKGPSEAVLFPLRQSERIEGRGGRVHVVQTGETLGDIANLYYSDPNRWTLILDDNRADLPQDRALRVGQAIKIPTVQGATLEESRFVIELAYKRRGAPLGALGQAAVSLPEPDADMMKATWHIFLPHSLEPVHFSGNLVQYSALRYDPFRRAKDFLRAAFAPSPAFAGERYKSILSTRKDIFQAEVVNKSSGEVVLASFPLVGERYRFKQVLLGRNPPTVEVFYVADTVATAVRWGSLGLAFALTLLLLGFRRKWWAWAVAAIGLGALLFVAHFVLGVHRRLLWGVDLALALAAVRAAAAPLRAAAERVWEAPGTLARLLTLRAIVLTAIACVLLEGLARHPALLPLVAAPVLGWIWLRAQRARRTEVHHAA